MLKRSNETWKSIIRQIEIFQDTAAYTAILDETTKKLDEAWAALKDPTAPENELRYSQGAIYGLSYGIMIFQELLNQAKRSSERSKTNNARSN